MNIKNSIKIALVSTTLAFSTTSCNDWLNVEMEDEIMENSLFKNDDGYLSTLNACYIRMNENYADMLTRGGIDVMAQYYHMSPLTEHGMYKYVAFQYSQLEGESNTLWTNQYKNIANLNVVLDHVDKDNNLSEKYYNYVKGEALALRAFLHFDLMRLYGPIYGPDTESRTTIPYQKTTSKEIQPLLSAKEVMTNIVSDLKESVELLKKDRIREDGVMNQSTSTEKPTLRYRQFRLNYYAAKLLLARVYMWMGDMTNAETVAKELIAENNEERTDADGNKSTYNPFPWVNKTTQLDTPSDGNPDRIFSTEVMFGLYNTNRASFFNSRFATTLNMNGALFLSNWTFKSTEYDYTIWDYPTYEYNKLNVMLEDINDLRRRFQWVSSKLNGGGDDSWNADYLLKFEPLQNPSGALTDISKTSQYMIPLIRLSEAYTILAECELAKGNLQGAIDNLNVIRVHRNTPNLNLAPDATAATVKDLITLEFMREVIGEGQLFFYYKRNAMTEIMSDAVTTTKQTKSMELGNYVWPMPNVEMDKRTTTNK